MKKLLFLGKGLLLLCLFTTHFAQSQTVSTAYATQINATFANLDKTKIPHKLLVDYAMEFEELSAYNGTLTTQNLVSVGNYSGIYNTLLMARVLPGVVGLVSPTTFKTNWNNLRQENKIVLSGLYYKYSEFKPDAPNNTITITNSKLYDKYVGGVWQNPYNEKQVFAMSAPIATYKSLSMQVQLPSALWYTNQASSVQNIAIDFNDGLGYQPIAFGQLKTVTYSTSGLKEWKYKLTLTNGQILYSHSKLFIDAEIPPSPTTSVQRTIIEPCSVDAFGIDKVQFQGTRQYLGIANQATIEIDYANTDGCGTIQKPLIVVEGFDSGLFGLENGLGDVSLQKFRTSTFNGFSNLPEQLNTYDIIYINFKNGKDYMQRNAYLVEDIIKWVNAQKALAGSTTPNVVLGQSMGGLIARYALRDMENLGEAHQTSLYISHDAPHQGANIPLSLQYFARHLADQFVSTPLGDININITGNGGEVTIEDMQNLLNAQGTKQLLIDYVTSGFVVNNTVGNAWRTELKNMGYPQQTRNIALSNGSHCAVPQNFNPSDNLFSLTGNAQTKLLVDLFLFLHPMWNAGTSIGLAVMFNEPGLLIGILPGNSKFDINFNGKALPNVGSTSQIYKGKISFTKTLFSLFGWTPRITVNLTDRSYNAPGGLSYDYYPGGKYDSFISGGGVAASNMLISYGINMQARDSFNFIPTPSALDVGSGIPTLYNSDYFVKYNAATPPTGTKTIPFVNFTSSYNTSSTNEEHISFNTRNGNWLALELDTISNNEENFNCINFCANAQITGNSFLCTTGIYSVTSEANPSFTNWSITEGNSLVTFVTSGNQITINQVNVNTKGYITITANYQNSNCGAASVSKRIWVGKPRITNNTLIGATTVYKNASGGYSVNSPGDGVSHYVWSITAINPNCGCTTNSDGLRICPPSATFPKFYESNSSTYSTTIPSAIVVFGNCIGQYQITLTAHNACGSTIVKSTNINVVDNNTDPCENSLSVYPNPVEDNTLVVSLLPPGDPCGGLDPNARTANINNLVKIYDLYGNLVYSNNYNTDQIKINDINLKRGHYFLNVFTSEGKSNKEVIIVK